MPLRILFVAISISFAVSFMYFRHQNKMFDIAKKLNDMIHYIFDKYCEINNKRLSQRYRSNLKLKSIVEKLCEYICEYFQVLKRTNEIGVAIRIAYENKKRETVFSTFGRSNLSEERAKTSQDIPSNVGIPKLLAGKKMLVFLLVMI